MAPDGERSEVDPNKLTLKSQAALESARQQAVARSQQAIEPEHLLFALLSDPEGVVFPLLHALDVVPKSLRDRVDDALDRLPKVYGQGASGEVRISPATGTVLDRAFAQADVILSVGTRFNYIVQFGQPPRFAENLKVIQVDVNPAELGHNRAVDVPIAGDARAVLEQLVAEAKGKIDPKRYGGWASTLRTIDDDKQLEMNKAMSNDQTPIHPLRLCKEVRDFMRRDGILVVDGQEILNFGRQAIPTFVAGHRLNSGAFGTMGVGLPFGVGAKVARPDTQVLVLHGDGSYGINAMEMDTAVRHKIPVVVVISNNGGWTADAPWTRPLPKPGRNLGHTRYDRVAQELGAHGEFVEKPHDIRPALERAFASGKPAVVNVITDGKARAQTVRFSAYTT